VDVIWPKDVLVGRMDTKIMKENRLVTSVVNGFRIDKIVVQATTVLMMRMMIMRRGDDDRRVVLGMNRDPFDIMLRRQGSKNGWILFGDHR
jgi:hypothetical protein